MIDDNYSQIPIVEFGGHSNIFQSLNVKHNVNFIYSRWKKTWRAACFEPRSEDERFYEANGFPSELAGPGFFIGWLGCKKIRFLRFQVFTFLHHFSTKVGNEK